MASFSDDSEPIVSQYSVIKHPSVSMSDRTLLTTNSLPQNVIISSTPFDACLSLDLIKTDTEMIKILEHANKIRSTVINRDDTFAIFIILSLISPQTTLQNNFTVLTLNFPKVYESTVFQSTATSRLLLNTTLATLTISLREQIANDHTAIRSVLESYDKEAERKVEPLFTKEAYVHALFSVFSRSTDIPKGGERERIVVPFMDMLNHSPKSTVHHQYNASTHTVDIVSGSANIPTSTEVLLNYGAIPNQRLVLFYGFAIDGNSCDTADVYVPLSPAVPLYDEKARIMKDVYGWEEGPFRVDKSGNVPPALLGLLRLLPVENRKIIGECSSSGNNVSFISRENEEGGLKALEGALDGMSRAIKDNLEAVKSEFATEEERKEKDGFMYRCTKLYVESERDILCKCLIRVRLMINALK